MASDERIWLRDPLLAILYDPVHGKKERDLPRICVGFAHPVRIACYASHKLRLPFCNVDDPRCQFKELRASRRSVSHPRKGRRRAEDVVVLCVASLRVLHGWRVGRRDPHCCFVGLPFSCITPHHVVWARWGEEFAPRGRDGPPFRVLQSRGRIAPGHGCTPTRGRREYGSSVPRQQAERRRCGFWSHVTATWNGSGHLEEVTWLRGRRFGEGRDVDSRKTNRRPPRRNRCRRVYTIPPVRRWKSRFKEMEAMVVQVEGRRDGGNGWSR